MDYIRRALLLIFPIFLHLSHTTRFSFLISIWIGNREALFVLRVPFLNYRASHIINFLVTLIFNCAWVLVIFAPFLSSIGILFSFLMIFKLFGKFIHLFIQVINSVSGEALLVFESSVFSCFSNAISDLDKLFAIFLYLIWINHLLHCIQSLFRIVVVLHHELFMALRQVI